MMFDKSERNVSRKLPVKITGKEFEERAQELAGIDKQLEEIDAERKSALEGFKQRKGAVLLRKSELLRAVRERIEDRDTDCEWQENFKQKCWQLVRLDTKEVVDRIAMTAEDLQGTLPGTDGKKKDSKKKSDKKSAAAGEKKDEKGDEKKPASTKKPVSKKKGKSEEKKDA